MAIVTRLTRLFKADMHAVLDRMEEPDVLLRHAVREMEEEVAQSTRQLKAREQERASLLARAADCAAPLANISAELDLCFAAGNEALARTLLRRKLETERLCAQLRAQAARLDKLIEEQRPALDEQRRRLEGMRQKAELLESEPENLRGESGAPSAVSDADVEIAFLREQQKRSAS